MPSRMARSWRSEGLFRLVDGQEVRSDEVGCQRVCSVELLTREPAQTGWGPVTMLRQAEPGSPHTSEGAVGYRGCLDWRPGSLFRRADGSENCFRLWPGTMFTRIGGQGVWKTSWRLESLLRRAVNQNAGTDDLEPRVYIQRSWSPGSLLKRPERLKRLFRRVGG